MLMLRTFLYDVFVQEGGLLALAHLLREGMESVRKRKIHTVIKSVRKTIFADLCLVLAYIKHTTRNNET